MNKKQKIAILSISLLIIMSSSAISPALPYIGEYFSDSSELMIKMVISLPAIFIIPVTLITGRLIFYIKRKHLLYIGLSLYIIGGLGGALQNSIYFLLAFRALMGIGIGVLIPLTRGVIADLFTGKERVKMMGYSSAVNNLGGIIATVLAGLLTVYGWRYPFLVYILAFVVLILVILYLPNQDIPSKETHKIHINRNVWILGFTHYMMILTFFAVPAGLGYFISANNFGGGFVTGLLISLVSLLSFILGMVFHYLNSFLKGGTVLSGLILLTLGMLGIGLSSSLLELTISLVFVGFGMGIIPPMIYLQTSLVSSKNDVTLSLAIVSIFSFLGQFSSPLINSFFQTIFNYHSVGSPFIISALIGLITIVVIIFSKFINMYKTSH
jgi:MFS family permease